MIREISYKSFQWLQESVSKLTLIDKFYDSIINMLEYMHMITSFICCEIKFQQKREGLKVMRKLIAVVGNKEFHRVWNLVVPVHSLRNNSSLQSIPPLKKYSHRKKEQNQEKFLLAIS